VDPRRGEQSRRGELRLTFETLVCRLFRDGVSLIGLPERTMTSTYKNLQIAVAVSGVAFLLIYPLAVVWPSGWPGSPARPTSPTCS
jgi:hypothetical protein